MENELMDTPEMVSPMPLGDAILSALEGRTVWAWDCGEFARLSVSPNGDLKGILERDSFGGWVVRRESGEPAAWMRIIGGARISQQGKLLVNKIRY